MTKTCLYQSASGLTGSGWLLLACLVFSAHAANPLSAPVKPAPIAAAARLSISVADYQDKVYASWLGQIIGNIYGLSYEFQFINQPGPDRFPYGFGPALQRVIASNGAFSDDDTDIEYMYLLQMEKHGIEPTYAQLADAWQYHVRDKVWVANRAALTLMRAGYSPPLTGNKRLNPQWFQIDPQLVNEIWATTAPGMLDYATQKSAWAAKITNDDFGIEPTIHYAAMYAAAFFESDIQRLIDIGVKALPGGSRFAATVEHMKQLYRQYPDDWQQARKVMAEHYYKTVDYNRHAWAVVDANLNGACSILALLYGQGDFQRTLDIASGLGFDADNQAATMSGLLGIIKGVDGLPDDLLYPLGREKWQKPFNDFYHNVSRHDLPDASLQDMANRMAQQGEKVILANGGRRISHNGTDHYEINTRARFTAPFELVSAPTLQAAKGKAFSFRYYFGDHDFTTARLAGGTLPPGITIKQHSLQGNPSKPGHYAFGLTLSSGEQVRRQDYQITVHGENLAKTATRILYNGNSNSSELELIRDGRHRDKTYYNRSATGVGKNDYYGYLWNRPQRISTLLFNPGLPEEWGGWFTSLMVQYRDAAGQWQAVKQLDISPAMDFDNSQWLKGSYIDHTLSFAAVTTKAIRITGAAGGIEQDARNGGKRQYYSAISELAVYNDQ